MWLLEIENSSSFLAINQQRQLSKGGEDNTKQILVLEPILSGNSLKGGRGDPCSILGELVRTCRIDLCLNLANDRIQVTKKNNGETVLLALPWLGFEAPFGSGNESRPKLAVSELGDALKFLGIAGLSCSDE